MKTFAAYRQEITERFHNLWKPEDKEPIVDQVWDMIQRSYEYIGGIKGSGFGSKEDMIAKIPFWKVATSNGKIVAVKMYKHKEDIGRKSVAVANDGSTEGLKYARMMAKEDLDRAMVEVSGKALGSMVKNLGVDFLMKYIHAIPDVKKFLKGDEIVAPDQDDFVYQKFAPLRPYMYGREIGGEVHTKVMLGTPGNPIQFDESSQANPIRRPSRPATQYDPRQEAENAKLSALQPTRINGKRVVPVDNHAPSQAYIRRPDLTTADWNTILKRMVMKLERLATGKYLVYSTQYSQAVVVFKTAAEYKIKTVFPKGHDYNRGDSASVVVEGLGTLQIVNIK